VSSAEAQAQYEVMMAAQASYDTAAEVEAYLGTAGQTTTTGTGGATPALTLGEGYYWFVESGYSGEGMISGSEAVPFGLVLPMIDPATNEARTDVHVYPKNTVGNEPTVDKDVTEVGNDSDSANVGDNVEWIILPTLPEDIATYKMLKFTDDIDPALDYQNRLRVLNGSVAMLEGTDYTVTEPAVGAAGGQLVVEFTATGIAKLTPGTNLEIRFLTSINDTAVVGLPIPNDVTLEYTNGHDVTGEPATVPEEEQPEVWTGGKRFEKVVEGTTDKLAGAVFRVEELDGTTATPVVWTADLIAMNQAAITAGKFAADNGDGTYTATTAPVVGQPIYVISAADGSFEIAGLQGYEPTSGDPATVDDKINTISHPGTYQLVEVAAPAGYAMLPNPIPFTVTKTSYWSDPVALTAAAPQEVENKRVTIPETGGIGTIVFTLAGLALMGGAAYGMRRRTVKA
jgi:fimbrial isopeptide formation D2 family protein/LPXTG-motif cell wall-anchored protein